MESLREKASAFVSYAREDSKFALRLAADLKAKGANVWVDQLDISPGRQWDREVEHALLACSQMLVILSPAAFESNNVRDEVSFALEERKTVIPVLHQDCPIPFRLRRVQYVDFRLAYEPAVEAVLGVVRAENQVGSVTTPINHPISASLRSTETSDPGAAERENAETTWKAQQERLNRESVEVAPKAERDPRKREKAVPKAEKNRLDREKAQAAPVSSSSDRDQKVFV